MRRDRGALSAEPDELMLLDFSFYFVFVTFSLVGIDVFSVDVLAAVLILIAWLDTFSFWVHAFSSGPLRKTAALKQRRMNRRTERSLITRRRSGQRIWYGGRNWTARTFYNEGASYRRSSKSDNLVKVGRFIVGHGIELFRLAEEKNWKV
jgi:hypothetical protein